MSPCLLMAVFVTSFVLSRSEEPSSAAIEDGSELPLMASSGKRQHNIMRFGKRPAGGHSLIHFGKRDQPQHRFLFMGKREDEGEDPYFPFLQKEDNSYKRGHTIMRFGKRTPPQGSHSFIRFGKREEDDEVDNGEEEKRANNGHSMMYFGKRAGHNMMYFGKRGNGHSMMYFGKRDEDSDEDQPPIYWSPEMTEKRNNNNFLRFGKKTEGSRARGSHAMIHFGKRSAAEGSNNDSMVTRTKRDAVDDEEEIVELPLYYPQPPVLWTTDEDSSYSEEPEKKDGSKNVFLRFG